MVSDLLSLHKQWTTSWVELHGLSTLIQVEDRLKKEILPPLPGHAYLREDYQGGSNNIMLVTCGELALTVCVYGRALR